MGLSAQKMCTDHANTETNRQAVGCGRRSTGSAGSAKITRVGERTMSGDEATADGTVRAVSLIKETCLAVLLYQRTCRGRAGSSKPPQA